MIKIIMLSYILYNNNNNNNLLYYMALFWVLRALYIEGGGGDLLNHHQCAASTLMMQRQPYCTRMPNTHQFIGGAETEETITLLTLVEETIVSPCLDKKNIYNNSHHILYIIY